MAPKAVAANNTARSIKKETTTSARGYLDKTAIVASNVGSNTVRIFKRVSAASVAIKEDTASAIVMVIEEDTASTIKRDTAWKKVRHLAPTTNRDFLEIAMALGDDTAVTAGGGSPFGRVGGRVHGETRGGGG
jgi:hypothetical protein